MIYKISYNLGENKKLLNRMQYVLLRKRDNIKLSLLKFGTSVHENTPLRTWLWVANTKQYIDDVL